MLKSENFLKDKLVEVVFNSSDWEVVMWLVVWLVV